MKDGMERARVQLGQLLEKSELTAGMYVRVHGDHLLVGRRERVAGSDVLQDDDRVRFTRLSTRTYGLSVKRHTGRWQRTPFSGTLPEMVETVCTFMQHLVGPY